jgi:hypothetical protein
MFLHRGTTVWGVVAFIALWMGLKFGAKMVYNRMDVASKAARGANGRGPIIYTPTYQYQQNQFRPSQWNGGTGVPQYQYR